MLFRCVLFWANEPFIEMLLYNIWHDIHGMIFLSDFVPPPPHLLLHSPLTSPPPFSYIYVIKNIFQYQNVWERWRGSKGGVKEEVGGPTKSLRNIMAFMFKRHSVLSFSGAYIFLVLYRMFWLPRCSSLQLFCHIVYLLVTVLTLWQKHKGFLGWN